MTFSERIEAFLSAKKWKPADLVRASGLTAPTVSQILSGERVKPGIQVLESLVKNTEIDPYFLLTGEGSPIKSPATFAEGLPHEARAAVQKAVQMVEDFIAVVPKDKRLQDNVKKGLFVMLLADLLVAGRQDEIPGVMANILKAFSAPQESL